MCTLYSYKNKDTTIIILILFYEVHLKFGFCLILKTVPMGNF